MKIPKADADTVALFKSMVPQTEGVTTKPMFGNVSAFVNGNLFMGVFGDDILLRLPEAEVQRLLKEEGASLFEPMKGRTMKGYVLVPKPWHKDTRTLQKWIGRSLEFASDLPAKKPRKK